MTVCRAADTKLWMSEAGRMLRGDNIRGKSDL